MRRRLLIVLIPILVLLWPAARAGAHAVDSVNTDQYTRLEVGSSRVRVHYLVEMGEIPAYHERRAIDTNADGQFSAAEQQRYMARRVPELLAGLGLSADGAPLELRVLASQLSFPKIVIEDVDGGLTTLQIVLDLEARLPELRQPLRLIYRNTNFDERTGWREIIVRPQGHLVLRDATVPERDQSDELRAFPPDALAHLLDVRTASVTVVPSAAAAVSLAPAAPLARQAPAGDSAFVDLLRVSSLTPQVMLIALLAAFGLGAGHALAPGHGKAIVAAYLVGNRGCARHAIVLGLTTTITHTLGVFVLGALTLLISNYILPERLFPWLELLSGALVVAIGVAMFRQRLADLLGRRAAHHHDHDHDHGHEHHHHGHEHHHHHHDQPITWRGLLALGISGGLLPCPSALVVLLAAVAVHRVALGMLLILAFSLGLAAVLSGIGLLLVYAQRLFARLPSDGRLLRAVSVASAAAVTLAGLTISVGALAQL